MTDKSYRMKSILRFLRKEKRSRGWSRIYYVVENANWSVRWDGIYITTNVEKLFGVKSRIVTDYTGIRNQILHYGSRGLYVPHKWKKFDKSNKVIFTWFHGNKGDPNPQNLAMIEDLPNAVNICEFIHTTNSRTRERLIEWGVSREKIIVIPLGVDLNLFKPVNQNIKETIRKELGVPEGSVCIGSFQKDGVGWGAGDDPKLVKGPDIFCNAVVELSKMYPLYVLLIGPARGYVKKRLAEAKIAFYHKYIENFLDIPKYYHALDIYLVTSRDEGGPKAILESMASGIPIVTTDVGMARDVVNHGKNGFIAEIENVDEIVKFASKVLDDREKSNAIISNALETVKIYSWENIARLYYKKMYSNLLRK
jgi:glycosyltransferase involved in cell wall biosynthesis